MGPGGAERKGERGLAALAFVHVRPFSGEVERLRIPRRLRCEALQVESGQTSLLEEPCRFGGDDGDRIGLENEGAKKGVVQILALGPLAVVDGLCQVAQVGGIEESVQDVSRLECRGVPCSRTRGASPQVSVSTHAIGRLWRGRSARRRP